MSDLPRDPMIDSSRPASPKGRIGDLLYYGLVALLTVAYSVLIGVYQGLFLIRKVYSQSLRSLLNAWKKSNSDFSYMFKRKRDPRGGIDWKERILIIRFFSNFTTSNLKKKHSLKYLFEMVDSSTIAINGDF